MEVYPKVAVLKIFGWDQTGMLQGKQCNLPWESYQYTSLKDSVDVGNFFPMDETYGCPDCADGGAEWIEISVHTLKHRVTFEYLNAPEGLAAIASALREVMENFEDCDP